MNASFASSRELSNLFHYAVGFEQDFDGALVVDEVGIAELAAFAVFEPFLGGLVATNVEVPGEFGHVAEILGFVDPYFVVGVADLFDQAIASHWESGLVIIDDGGAHQVELAQFAPEGHQAVKLSLGRDGDAGEVDFKEFFVFFTVRWAVKNSIDIVKYLFWFWWCLFSQVT